MNVTPRRQFAVDDIERPLLGLNDFTRQWQDIEHDVLSAVRRVGHRGWYILGAEVRAFETHLATMWGVPYAVGVASGLDALEICLRCLGVARGQAVLTTPLSAFATALAVLRVGAKPVFVDVDATGLLDLERCKAVLRRRPDIRVLLPVHLYGHALDLGDLAALRDEFDLTVVEDCAQSIGAGSNGRATGTVGRMAATSFYPTKNLGTLGDGGAVLTAERALAERASSLRHYGQTSTYVHDHVGLNSRLDELHAAILRDAMLPRLEKWTSRRQAIAGKYRQELENPRVAVPSVPPRSRSVWHLFPVILAPEKRSALLTYLRERRIEAGLHYPRLIPDQRALREGGEFEVIGELEQARRLAGGEVSLPIHPFLTDDDVQRVIAVCNEWDG